MCHKFNKNHTVLELPFVSELYKYPVSEATSLEPEYQLCDVDMSVSNDLSRSPHVRSIADDLMALPSFDKIKHIFIKIFIYKKSLNRVYIMI